MSTEIENVRARSRELVAAEVAQDTEAALAFWAEDGVAQPAGTPQVKGLDEIRALYDGFFSQIKRFESIPSHLEVSQGGDLAYEYGVNRIVVSGPEGEKPKEVRMNRVLTTAVGLVLAVAALPTLATAQGGEWTMLFDGSSLDGWRVLGDANWELADGAVSANSGGGFLVSEESYGDFELRLEFWVDEPANSGVFIRCADPQNVNDRNCYEVNIYDTRADQTYRTGGIVHLAAPTTVINAGGRWNTYEITARGSRLVVILNGTQTVDTTDDQFGSGPLALQYGAGTVRFRNVQIRSLN